MVVTRSQRKAAACDTNSNSNTSSNHDDHNHTNNTTSNSDNQNGHEQQSSSCPIKPNNENVSPTPTSPSKEKATTKPTTPTITKVAMMFIAFITIMTYPETLQPVGKPTLNHVWYFGWISALSTGLGVLPLVFSPKFDTYWVGVTNGKFVMCSII